MINIGKNEKLFVNSMDKNENSKMETKRAMYIFDVALQYACLKKQLAIRPYKNF